jgi:hypothetical protein
MKKLIVIGLCLCLGAPMMADAQGKMKTKDKGHYVKTKMKTPAYTRADAPGKDYVYIKDDWTWNENTGTWDWNGNRWVTPSPDTHTWVDGHWRKDPGGWTWVEGHWK